MTRIKIALVDDHVLLRQALADVIDTFDDCTVVLQANNGREMIERLNKANQPNLVLLDVSMPEMDGYETAKWLTEHYPEIYILVLTMYDSQFALIRLFHLGARGYVKKNIRASDLHMAIQFLVKNGYYYSDKDTGKIMSLAMNSDQRSVSGTMRLTDNEMHFLQLAATEKSYKEIAAVMGVSPRTVDNYRDSLFDKLKLRTRVGIVLYGIKNGIISID